MDLINSFRFQLYFILCALVPWDSSAYGSDITSIHLTDRRLSDHRLGRKIVFPEPAVSDKYDYLFAPTLPQKTYYRKDYRFKPYLSKSKPNFRYNYRKLHDIPRVPPYTPYMDKGSLYQITQDLLRKAQLALGNKYNDQRHDPGVKPVVEHIKNDLKYDFRTKTHYYDN